MAHLVQKRKKAKTVWYEALFYLCFCNDHAMSSVEKPSVSWIIFCVCLMIYQHFTNRQKYVWSLGWCIFKGVSQQLQLCWMRALQVPLNLSHFWAQINLMPGLQRGAWRKKLFGGLPSVPGSIPEWPSGSWELPESGQRWRQWNPPLNGKGEFPEFQGIPELVLGAAIMMLEGMLGVISASGVISRPLTPSPQLHIQSGSSPGSLWPWRTGRQDEAEEGQPGSFHVNSPCMLKQIQPACEPGSPGEPSKWHGRGQESFVCCPSAEPAPWYLGVINCD